MLGISFAVLTVVLLLAGTWYLLNRRERRSELYAIHEFSREISLRAERALKAIGEFRAQQLLLYKSETRRAIDEQIEACVEAANKRVPLLVDKDFFIKAAKSVFPKKSWKEDFRLELGSFGRELLDQSTLRAGLETSSELLLNRVRQFLSEQLNALSAIPLQVSAATQLVLKKLRQEQHRRDFLFGSNSDLNKLLDINLSKDAIIGTATLATGIVGIVDPELVLSLCAAALRDLIGPELGQQVAATITEWIVQEIGEQAFMELAELAGAALTGIGLIFVGYKIIRYSLLFKRLFIDQEPLAKMRETVRMKCWDLFEIKWTRSIEHAGLANPRMANCGRATTKIHSSGVSRAAGLGIRSSPSCQKVQGGEHASNIKRRHHRSAILHEFN